MVTYWKPVQASNFYRNFCNGNCLHLGLIIGLKFTEKELKFRYRRLPYTNKHYLILCVMLKLIDDVIVTDYVWQGISVTVWMGVTSALQLHRVACMSHILTPYSLSFFFIENMNKFSVILNGCHACSQMDWHVFECPRTKVFDECYIYRWRNFCYGFLHWDA